MRRLTLILVAFFCLVLDATAAETVRYTMKYKGEMRTYWLYVPEGANPATPLVLVLHGYGGSAEGYCPAMLEVAEREGFAVCYPQGEKDAKGKTGWNVGYDVQQGLERDDVGFVKALVKHLRKTHHIGKDNVFMSGMSNGGEMTYFMAYRYPDLFRAYATIAGLTMQWAYKEWKANPCGKAIPPIQVDGGRTSPCPRPWATGPRRPAARTRKRRHFRRRVSIPSSCTGTWAGMTVSRSVCTKCRAPSTAGTSPIWTLVRKCGLFSAGI